MYCLAILQTNCIDIYFLAHREILFGLPPAPPCFSRVLDIFSTALFMFTQMLRPTVLYGSDSPMCAASIYEMYLQ